MLLKFSSINEQAAIHTHRCIPYLLEKLAFRGHAKLESSSLTEVRWQILSLRELVALHATNPKKDNNTVIRRTDSEGSRVTSLVRLVAVSTTLRRQ